MAKQWNDFSELPEQGQKVEVKFKGGIVCGVFEGDHVLFPNTAHSIDALVQSGEKWKPAPEESTDKTLNDSKTIPNELLLRWLAEKFLEEYGTIAKDLEVNADKIICRYNAGVVTK